MSGLVSGYGSSDDESAPLQTASSSKLPRLDGSYAPAAEDEEEDDEQLEQQAKADAFGLTAAKAAGEIQRKSDQKALVSAAPDVLKEVSVVGYRSADRLTTRIPTVLARQS